MTPPQLPTRSPTRRPAARLPVTLFAAVLIAGAGGVAGGCADTEYGGALPRRPAGESPAAPTPTTPPERPN